VNQGSLDPEAVLADVRHMVVEIIGEDYVDELDVGLDTSFRADLDIESIEFIALGEMLQERYSRVDFAEWIATMEVDDIIELSVGQLVEYIGSCYR
jgi:acyl carrier protein